MTTTDKRELILVIKGDDKASGPLRKVGDAADDAKDDLQELNVGLKKLDDSSAEATAQIAKLRAEIGKTGDLELVKDIAKQEQRLKAFARQRKLLLGDDDKPGSKLKLPDIDVAGAGIGIAARIGPVIVSNLPKAMTSGGGAGAALAVPLALSIASGLAAVSTTAIVAGGAAAAVAGGIKIASRDPRVQAAGTELGAAIGSQLERSFAPFVPATLDGIGVVRSEFGYLDDDLKAIGARAADYVEPFARGIMGLAREGAPGLRRLVDAARPLVQAFRDAGPKLGKAFGDALETISENADTAAVVFTYLVDVIGVGVRTVAGFIDIFSKVFKYLDLMRTSVEGPNAVAAKAMEYKLSADSAKSSTTDWAAELEKLGSKSSVVAAEVESLAEMIDRLTSEAMNSENAAIALEEAIDGAAERAKEGAKGININTEAGRENRKALLEIAEAAKGSAAAIFETTQSQELASEATEQGRAAFLKSAAAMGVSKREATELANKLFGLPKDVSTKAKFNPDNKGVSKWKETLSGIPRNILISARFRLLNSPDVAMALRLGRLSAGGPVEGPGPKGVDSQPYLLAPGEYVLSAKDVDKLGGSGRIDEWRKGLHEATRPAAVAGSAGGGGGGGSVGVRVSAAPGPMQEVVRMLLPYLRVEIANSYGGSAQRAVGTGRG